jgi:uncharacterized protein (TIGR00369 family)
MEIEVDQYCFVCGPENPEGLKARFQAEGGKAEGRFQPRSEHQGYAGVSHGGILAAILDESMVYAAVTLGRWVSTAELVVRYHRPAPTGVELVVRAEVLRHQRRLVECSAEILDGEGTRLASATGKLMQGRELRPGELRAGSRTLTLDT